MGAGITARRCFVSAGDADAIHTLARWRRAGHGIWKMTFIIEGYDDEFIQLLPGRLSQRKASNMAMQQIAFEFKIRKCYIILKTIVKEG